MQTENSNNRLSNIEWKDEMTLVQFCDKNGVSINDIQIRKNKNGKYGWHLPVGDTMIHGYISEDAVTAFADPETPDSTFNYAVVSGVNEATGEERNIACILFSRATITRGSGMKEEEV